MLDHALAEFPENFAELPSGAEREAQARAMVRAAVTKAEQLGVETEGGIEDLLEIMLVESPDFDTAGDEPWVRQLLADEDLTGDEKVELIHLRLFVEDDER